MVVFLPIRFRTDPSGRGNAMPPRADCCSAPHASLPLSMQLPDAARHFFYSMAPTTPLARHDAMTLMAPKRVTVRLPPRAWLAYHCGSMSAAEALSLETGDDDAPSNPAASANPVASAGNVEESASNSSPSGHVTIKFSMDFSFLRPGHRARIVLSNLAMFLILGVALLLTVGLLRAEFVRQQAVSAEQQQKQSVAAFGSAFESEFFRKARAERLDGAQTQALWAAFEWAVYQRDVATLAEVSSRRAAVGLEAVAERHAAAASAVVADHAAAVASLVNAQLAANSSTPFAAVAESVVIAALRDMRALLLLSPLVLTVDTIYLRFASAADAGGVAMTSLPAAAAAAAANRSLCADALRGMRDKAFVAGASQVATVAPIPRWAADRFAAAEALAAIISNSTNATVTAADVMQPVATADTVAAVAILLPSLHGGACLLLERRSLVDSVAARLTAAVTRLNTDATAHFKRDGDAAALAGGKPAKPPSTFELIGRDMAAPAAPVLVLTADAGQLVDATARARYQAAIVGQLDRAPVQSVSHAVTGEAHNVSVAATLPPFSPVTRAHAAETPAVGTEALASDGTRSIAAWAAVLGASAVANGNDEPGAAALCREGADERGADPLQLLPLAASLRQEYHVVSTTPYVDARHYFRRLLVHLFDAMNRDDARGQEFGLVDTALDAEFGFVATAAVNANNTCVTLTSAPPASRQECAERRGGVLRLGINASLEGSAIGVSDAGETVASAWATVAALDFVVYVALPHQRVNALATAALVKGVARANLLGSRRGRIAIVQPRRGISMDAFDPASRCASPVSCRFGWRCRDRRPLAATAPCERWEALGAVQRSDCPNCAPWSAGGGDLELLMLHAGGNASLPGGGGDALSAELSALLEPYFRPRATAAGSVYIAPRPEMPASFTHVDAERFVAIAAMPQLGACVLVERLYADVGDDADPVLFAVGLGAFALCGVVIRLVAEHVVTQVERDGQDIRVKHAREQRQMTELLVDAIPPAFLERVAVSRDTLTTDGQLVVAVCCVDFHRFTEFTAGWPPRALAACATYCSLLCEEAARKAGVTVLQRLGDMTVCAGGIDGSGAAGLGAAMAYAAYVTDLVSARFVHAPWDVPALAELFNDATIEVFCSAGAAADAALQPKADRQSDMGSRASGVKARPAGQSAAASVSGVGTSASDDERAERSGHSTLRAAPTAQQLREAVVRRRRFHPPPLRVGVHYGPLTVGACSLAKCLPQFDCLGSGMATAVRLQLCAPVNRIHISAQVKDSIDAARPAGEAAKFEFSAPLKTVVKASVAAMTTYLVVSQFVPMLDELLAVLHVRWADVPYALRRALPSRKARGDGASSRASGRGKDD
jgi:hypothetical protein